MYYKHGRARAHAVSRRLPTEAARVRSQVKSCRICGGQSGAGAGFLPCTSVSSANSHSPTAPRLSSGAGTIGQIVTDVPSGLSLTPPQETNTEIIQVFWWWWWWWGSEFNEQAIRQQCLLLNRLACFSCSDVSFGILNADTFVTCIWNASRYAHLINHDIKARALQCPCCALSLATRAACMR
jgi:hypothetical protein